MIDWDDFRTDNEPASISMENELLRWENQILRASVGPQDTVLEDLEVLEDLREAHNQLRWLLYRIGRPPFGLLMHRSRRYRALRDRWIPEL